MSGGVDGRSRVQHLNSAIRWTAGLFFHHCVAVSMHKLFVVTVSILGMRGFLKSCRFDVSQVAIFLHPFLTSEKIDETYITKPHTHTK